MPTLDQDLAMLQAENDALRERVAALEAEIEELEFEADLDACHAAGLSAQLRALIAEGDACPNQAAHSLLQRAEYTDSRSGEIIPRTGAYPLYRQAFDAEAREMGIEGPERYRG